MDHKIKTIRSEIENKKDYNNCCLELLSTIHELTSLFPREAYLRFDPPINHSEYTPPKNTWDIEKLAKDSLEDLLSSHSISDGKVVLSRHLPNLPGAGYDWIPDEDDYDETALILKNPIIGLNLAPGMQENEMKKVRSWYSSIVNKYS